MHGPSVPPPHGLAIPIQWTRVVDGDTIEAKGPSGREMVLCISGHDSPEKRRPGWLAAKHALESLLEETADLIHTAWIPLPEDRNHNGILDLDEILRSIASFARIKAFLWVGNTRVDTWMIAHGYAEEDS